MKVDKDILGDTPLHTENPVEVTEKQVAVITENKRKRSTDTLVDTHGETLVVDSPTGADTTEKRRCLKKSRDA